MLKNIITVNSTLVVVWYWSHDTSEKAPKKLHDLVNGACLVGGLVTLPLDVTGSDVWVLTRRTATGHHVLTRYYMDGRERTISRLPSGLHGAFKPLVGMPANVWAKGQLPRSTNWPARVAKVAVTALMPGASWTRAASWPSFSARRIKPPQTILSVAVFHI